MKRIALTLASMAMVVIAVAQQDNTQGIVTYEEVTKINIQLENMTPEMEAMMPKENRNSTVLYFNEDASRYQNLEQPDDELIEDESGGGAVKIQISQPENIIYRDLKNKTLVEQTEFLTRVFLIESGFPEEEWKFTGNHKTILDYPCQEATRGDGDDRIVAWFTAAIPVSSGPGEYADLPGLVLAVESNGGDRTIHAKSVELTDVPAEDIKKPKKGKKVSREEYLAIVEQKTKEMGGDGSAKGAHTVVMQISQ